MSSGEVGGWFLVIIFCKNILDDLSTRPDKYGNKLRGHINRFPSLPFKSHLDRSLKDPTLKKINKFKKSICQMCNSPDYFENTCSVQSDGLLNMGLYFRNKTYIM